MVYSVGVNIFVVIVNVDHDEDDDDDDDDATEVAKVSLFFVCVSHPAARVYWLFWLNFLKLARM